MKGARVTMVRQILSIELSAASRQGGGLGVDSAPTAQRIQILQIIALITNASTRSVDNELERGNGALRNPQRMGSTGPSVRRAPRPGLELPPY